MPKNKNSTTVPITVRISNDLHARIERVRAKSSLRPGDSTGSAPWTVIVRWALEDWAEHHERKLGIDKAKE